MKERIKSEIGSFLLIVAIMMVVLGMIVGLAIDSGRAYIMKAELQRNLDSAALAAASRRSAGLPAAQAAACNAARMNGVPCGSLTVEDATVTDASGNLINGVRVSASASIPTTFMRLARVLSISDTVGGGGGGGTAVAAPGGYVDLVMNLDDSGSMSSGSPSFISGAKTGATTLVNSLIPAGVSSAHNTRVSMVPFRGCYHINASGSTYGNCEDLDEYGIAGGDTVSLSFNNTTLRNSISALTANGGSGTNNCEGLLESRRRLFQAGTSRTNALKYMIVLTDATSSYDSSPGAGFSRCRPTSGGNANRKVNLLAYNIAQDIKNGQNVSNDGLRWGTQLSPAGSGQLLGQTVEIFVIMYGTNGPAPTNCTAPSGGTIEWNTTPLNLGRCIASSAANMYFAPTATQIPVVFQQIMSRLPVKIVK